MHNKKLFKILALVAAFLLIIFTWVVVKDAQRKRVANTPINTGLQNPFGTSSGENDLGEKGNGKKGNSSTSVSGTDVPDESPLLDVRVVEDNPALRKISDSAVAGFAFTTETREIPESNSTTTADNIVEVFDFSGYKTIKFGDTADEVVSIKTVLNRQTPSPNLVISNQYDTDMKNAVVDFQNRNSLTGDGVIGPKTYEKLNTFQGIKTFTSVKKPASVEIVPLIRYVDSSSGIIFDKPLRKAEDIKKVTLANVPRVVEAFFNDAADKVVMRYLKDGIIETYLARLTWPKIDPDMTAEEKAAVPKTATMDGEFLPQGILAIAPARDGKSMFYMNPISGGVAGITYNFATKAKKQIFETPLTEWIVDYSSSAKINLTLKASGLVDGYSYGLDTKTGAFVKNLGRVKGLTTLMSPDGKKLLYSESSGNSVSTFILDMATGKKTSISPSTLPEKCVWTKDSMKIYCAAPVATVTALYPDDWYKGKISFDDALWEVDLPEMTGNIIYDFISKNNAHVDAVSLSLNANEDYLGFINKKDGVLWGFDLSK